MFRRVLLVATVAVAAACGATSSNNNNNNGRDLSGEQLPDDMGAGDVDMRRPGRDMAFVDIDMSAQPAGDMAGQPAGDMAGQQTGDGGGPVTCTTVASWGQNRVQGYFWKAGDNSAQFAGAMMANTATPGAHLVLEADYWGDPAMYTVPSVGTITNTTTWGNCEHCVAILECTSDNPGSCTPKYLAQAGTLNVTAATAMTKGQFTATASNLHLVEWDFDNDVAVTNGACYDVTSASFNTQFNTPKSVLWFFGDYLTNNTSQLGQLDFYPPVGGGVYGNFPAASAWDIDNDGLSVALGTNQTVAGRYDLWTVDYDGGNAKKIVDMAGTTGKVTAVKFSPDAKKLAFIGDLTTAGVSDVYVVDLQAATPTPVKVTPARPGGTATNYQPELMAWSRGSKYLAFTADFQTNNKDSLYIVDTTAATPTAVVAVADSDILATPSGGNHTGVLSNLEWSATDQLIFKANLSAGATGFKLYRVDANGTNRTVLAKDGSNVDYEVGAFGLSPDGTQVAFSGVTTGTTYELFKMPTTGASAPVNLFKTNGANYSPTANRKPSFLTPIWWSPDGTRIAFNADYSATGAGTFEPHSVLAAGGAPVRLAAMVNTSAGWIAWSPDSSTIAFTAPQRVAGNIEVYRLIDATTADQPSTLVMSVVTSGDFAFNGPQLNVPVRWTF